MSVTSMIRVHVQLAGTPRLHLMITGGFLAVVAAFAGFSYYVSDSAGYARLDGIWLTIISLAQCAFLALLAPAAIRKALQRDFQSGMVESHRLSPMSNAQIVFGYMIGPAAQALMLYAVSLLAGSFFLARLALGTGSFNVATIGSAFGGWCFTQACLMVLAVVTGALSLLIGIVSNGKSNILGIIVAISVLGGWSLVFLVPGLALLLGVMSAGILSKFIGAAGGAPVDAATIVGSVLLQALLSVILLASACRKFRNPQRSLFSIPLALLLSTWAGITLVAGVALVPKHRWLFAGWSGYEFLQTICSTAAFMLIGWFALSAAAKERLELDRARAAAADGRGRSACDLIPAVLAAATMLVFYVLRELSQLPSLSLAPSGPPREAALLSASVLAAFVLSFWTDYNLIYAAAARRRRMLFTLILAVGIMKVAPLLVDSLATEMMHGAFNTPWAWSGYLAGLSPFGSILLMSSDINGETARGVPLFGGLAVQAVLALGSVAIARRARRAITASDSKVSAVRSEPRANASGGRE